MITLSYDNLIFQLVFLNSQNGNSALKKSYNLKKIYIYIHASIKADFTIFYRFFETLHYISGGRMTAIPKRSMSGARVTFTRR